MESFLYYGLGSHGPGLGWAPWHLRCQGAPPFPSLAFVWETPCYLVTSISSFARNTYHLFDYLCDIFIYTDEFNLLKYRLH